MGWIFFKSKYERLKTIESDDLESDPGMRRASERVATTKLGIQRQWSDCSTSITVSKMFAVPCYYVLTHV